MKEATLIQEQESKVKDKLHFSYLPAYARYLKENHLEAYVKELLAGCWELDLPLMKVLKDMPEEQLLALSLQSHGELLDTIANNKLRDMLEENLKKWEGDKMEIITREEIATKDITLGTFVRKRAMLKFLPLYTTDAFDIIEIVKEIDIYDAESVTASMDVYINILSDRISKQETQLLEAEKISNTASYEQDIETGKMVVSPQFLAIYEVPADFKRDDILARINPADMEHVIDLRTRAIDESGVYENKYRYTVNGEEKIIFVRGKVMDRKGRKVLVGAVQDVTERENLIDALQKRDVLFKQAQAQSHIGNWSWDLATNKIEWSDELYRIYELPIDTELTFEDITNFTHPDDKEQMSERLKKTFSTGELSEVIYRVVLKNGKEKILQAKSEIYIADGKLSKLVGAIQDITERQTLIDELQSSDKLFKQAQAQTNIGNWTWDVAPNKVSWSDEMYRIYGLEPQSVPVSFDTYISHVHPDYREKRLAQVQHVFETGEPEDHIYKIIAADGVEKILHSKSEIQTDENGKVTRMTGTCQDVTERQSLIEKLQESESLYKQAQVMSQMGSWHWDLKTDVVTWTDEMYEIYEIEKGAEEITRKHMVSFQHPEDRRTVEEGLRMLLDTNIVQDFNYRIITGKGKNKTLHAIKEIVRDNDGHPLKVIGTTQDVTAQKIAEKKLRDSQEFIQKIADTTPSIITSYNVNTGVYSYINEGLKKLLGYEPEQAKEEGVPFFINIMHPDDLERITLQNAEALVLANNPENKEQNFIAEFRYRMRHENGEYRWFHTFGTIFERDKAGKVDSVLNISIDITAQEEAERILSQKNIELQQSNASLEEYAYVASHDLKEPLRKICTFSDRLLSTQEEHLNKDGKLYLQKIIDSSFRMQTMISDLLSISLVSGNKAYESVSLSQILQETIHVIEEKIETKKAIVEADDLPEVMAVPSQFRQLFQNLVSNSLKFSREDVQPRIIINHRFLKASEVTDENLQKAKKYLELTFTDNGIGFENEFANKIFAIFQRLHGREEYEGTGIGLAICKKVVENHGGVIFANSKINEGSTFTIILPAK